MEKLYLKMVKLRSNMKEPNFEMKNLGCFNKNARNIKNKLNRPVHGKLLIPNKS